MFDITTFNRQSLHFHTELLEASDWCEAEVDRVLVITSNTLGELKLPDIPCSLDFYLEKTIKPELIKQNIFENQADVIIKFIRHNANFVQWMLGSKEK